MKAAVKGKPDLIVGHIVEHEGKDSIFIQKRAKQEKKGKMAQKYTNNRDNFLKLLKKALTSV